MNVIKTIEYPGPINNLRALMNEFFLLHFIWNKDEKRYNHFENTTMGVDAQATWSIRERAALPGVTSRSAIIFAVEKLPSKTTIQFIDGKDINGLYMTGQDCPFIGDDFREMAEAIEAEIGFIDKAPPEPQSTSLEEWFDFFYLVKRTRWKIDMGYIADQTHYSINTVYKEHTNYKNSHEIPKREVTVRRSKKK